MSPSASRNANRKRRARRNITLLKRVAEREMVGRSQAILTLYAVLAQQGGEVTLSKGTVEQTTGNLRNLSYTVDKSSTAEGEFIVRLVTKIEPILEPDNAGLSTVPGHDPHRDKPYVAPEAEPEMDEQGHEFRG